MKITAKDAIFIQNIKKKKKWTYLYNWQLNPCEADGFLLTGKIKPLTKILLFPVVCILGFFLCIWDGGLKEFPIAVKGAFSDPMGAREYPNDYVNSRYKRMKEVFERTL